MNSMQPFNELELVFENCEYILVDTVAIKTMRFTEKGRRYNWEQQTQTLDYCMELSNFELKLDLSRPQLFRRYAGQPDEHFGPPVERLKKCSDLCHVYINGECFAVPWGEDGGAYMNSCQETTLEGDTVTIRCKEK